jgi:hypothetical protein
VAIEPVTLDQMIHPDAKSSVKTTLVQDSIFRELSG